MAGTGRAVTEPKRIARPADHSTTAAAQTHAPGVEAIDAATPEAALRARHAALLGDPRLVSRFSPHQRARLLQHLQQGYGNGHVARVISQMHAPPGSKTESATPPRAEPAAAEEPAPLIGGPAQLQRAIAEPPPPPPPAPPPRENPGFQGTTAQIQQIAAQEKRHAPASEKAAEARQAAQPPPNDVSSQAAAAQVDAMSQQQPGGFDKAGFMNAVRQAIAAAAPKNLAEADDFKKSGKAEGVKSQVAGLAGRGKEQAAKDIKDTTNAPPDSSKAEPKPVTPMAAESPGPEAAAPSTDQAVPPPRPEAAVSLDHGPKAVEGTLAEANVTEAQLANANEPRFTEALAAKKQVDTQAREAPREFRAKEQDLRQNAQTQAGSAVAGHLSALRQSRVGAFARVEAGKTTAKAADEAKRAEIASQIEAIYQKTKNEVTQILSGLDQQVDAAFDAGEKAARAAFEDYIQKKTDAFKDERYSGPAGWARWVADKFSSPPELNQFVNEGRELYLKQMDAVISRVADLIGGELVRAKTRIAQGRQEVQAFVASRPKALQAIAHEAEEQFAGQFGQLESDVENKQGELVNTLAEKYTAARDAIDQRVAELHEANQGLVDQAVDAARGVVETILQLKSMLLGVLAQAADAIDRIIQDPIGFLGNLVAAVKQGLNQFVANIGTHLKKGLLGWLFGALAEGGIQLPESFDLKGILSVVLQLIGLTYQNLRARAVKLVGPQLVAKLEGVVDVFKILVTEGPAGLWRFVKEKFESLKDGLLGQIKDWVITRVIVAGVTWLISLLNPASAFVKACKAIYDIVMFFVERGSQIMGLVNAIIGSISAIASGAISSAANFVEQSLARAVPVAISFLASLLGLGGISEQIKKVVQTIQKPVNTIFDKLILGAVKVGKKLGLDKIGNKIKAGVGKVKKKAGQLRDRAKAKAGQIKGRLTGKGREKDGKKAPAAPGALAAAIADSEAALGQEGATPESVRATLPAIQKRYQLSSITLVADSADTYHVNALISRASTRAKKLGGTVKITLTRPRGFWKSTKEDLKAEFPEAHKQNVKSRALVRKDQARRHIIPVQQIISHYHASLNGQTHAAAAALLDPKLRQAGLDPVGNRPSNQSIHAAAMSLLRSFFNDVDNLFLGDSSENSSIQDAEDYPIGWSTRDKTAHLNQIKLKYYLK